MHNLSKNEQTALCILAFLVIAVVGLFVFLLGEYQKIAPNRAVLQAKEQELAKLEEDYGLPAFERVEKDILDAFNDGKDASSVFYEEELRNYQADKLIQEILDDAGFDIDNLGISELNTHGLTMSIFRLEDILYEIKVKATIGDAVIGGDEDDPNAPPPPPPAEGEAAEGGEPAPPPEPANTKPEDSADMDGMARFLAAASRRDALKWFSEEMENVRNGGDTYTGLQVVELMREFLANETETVMVQNVRFDIELDEDDVHDLSQSVFELPQATYILSLLPSSNQPTPPPAADGEPASAPSGNIVMEVEIMFLIVQPMNDPTERLNYRAKFGW
jgi:hypothetical protein